MPHSSNTLMWQNATLFRSSIMLELSLVLLAAELEAGERELLQIEQEGRDLRDEENRRFVERWLKGEERLES